MNPNTYQKLCERTECDQSKAMDRMDDFGPVSIRLNHSIIGLCGEVGELASLVQKWIYYGKQFTNDNHTNICPSELRDKLKDEFGDILWYVAEGLNALGLDMAEVMEANIRKLKTRYPERYTDEQAADENRNRIQEMQSVLRPYDEDNPPKLDLTKTNNPPNAITLPASEWIGDRDATLGGPLNPPAEYPLQPNIFGSNVHPTIPKEEYDAAVKRKIEQDGHGFGHIDYPDSEDG